MEFKRARPALGTIVVLYLNGPEEAAVDAAVVAAFERIEDLEQKLSKFREMSDVSRFNQVSVGRSVPVSHEFRELLGRSVELWRASERAFDPFAGAEAEPVGIVTSGQEIFAERLTPHALDLSGIAKGYIVDQAVELLRARGLGGVVNAGGDLRFFNCADRVAEVRLLGRPGTFRRVELSHDALATSSLSEANGNPLSNTRYAQIPRFDELHSVSVAAADGTTADALTKVGWFARPEVTRRLAKQLQAQFLIFDGEGRKIEAY